MQIRNPRGENNTSLQCHPPLMIFLAPVIFSWLKYWRNVADLTCVGSRSLWRSLSISNFIYITNHYIWSLGYSWCSLKVLGNTLQHWYSFTSFLFMQVLIICLIKPCFHSYSFWYYFVADDMMPSIGGKYNTFFLITICRMYIPLETLLSFATWSFKLQPSWTITKFVISVTLDSWLREPLILIYW